MHCLAKEQIERMPPGPQAQARILSYGSGCDDAVITSHSGSCDKTAPFPTESADHQSRLSVLLCDFYRAGTDGAPASD